MEQGESVLGKQEGEEPKEQEQKEGAIAEDAPAVDLSFLEEPVVLKQADDEIGGAAKRAEDDVEGIRLERGFPRGDEFPHLGIRVTFEEEEAEEPKGEEEASPKVGEALLSFLVEGQERSVAKQGNPKKAEAKQDDVGREEGDEGFGAQKNREDAGNKQKAAD